jgi:hypothetical protein
MEFDGSQMAFLRHHKITPDDIYDGRLVKDDELRKHNAKDAGKLFMLGHTCTKDSTHWISNRSGRCVQCNTAYIEFIRRESQTGHVYIAGSLKKKLIKIGFTTVVVDREKSINKSLLAGCDDWRILKWMKVDEGGKIERKAQDALKSFFFPCTCIKSKKEQPSKEVFSCSFLKALEALNCAVENEKVFDDKPLKNDFVSAYCAFPNRNTSK